MAILKIKQPDGSWAIVGDTSDAIKFTEQQLDEGQQEIARTNIGATSQLDFNDLNSSFEILNNSAVVKNATDQTIVGDIVISGNLTVTGEIDIQENDMIIGSVTLLANNWVGSEKPYTQVVEIPAASKNSKIDILLSLEQLEYFKENRISLTAINNAGDITFYALSNKPATDLTLQISITEVVKGFGMDTFLTKEEGASKEYVHQVNETTEKRLDRLESKLAPEYVIEDYEAAYEKIAPYYTCKYADLEWIEGKCLTDSEGKFSKHLKVTEIVSEPVNIWNLNWINDPDAYENTPTGYIVKVGGKLAVDAKTFLTLTGLKAGDTVTTSAIVTSASGTIANFFKAWVVLLSKNDKTHPHVELLPSRFVNGERKTHTVTIPEDFDPANYHGFYIYGDGANNLVEYTDFIISKGDKVAPYQPYKAEPTVISIPEEILAMDEYGREGSRLNFAENNLHVTYGKHTLTGTENWSSVNGADVVGDTGFYRYYLNTAYGMRPMKKGTRQIGFCDKFPSHYLEWNECTESSIRFGQDSGLVFLYHSEAMTQVQIRELTKGMTIYYPLATEIDISVDTEFDGLLEVGGSATIRFENEDKKEIAVPSKITYMLKEDAQFEQVS